MWLEDVCSDGNFDNTIAWSNIGDRKCSDELDDRSFLGKLNERIFIFLKVKNTVFILK